MGISRGTALGDKDTWIFVCVHACVYVCMTSAHACVGGDVGMQAEGGAWGHSHDVSEHTRSPDVRGRADGVSLYHLRS